jgi:hypothetical protein
MSALVQVFGRQDDEPLQAVSETRLRLQMLAPLSMRCSWKRRTASGVAVSGERLSQAANRLQLGTWLRCVCGLSLRAAVTVAHNVESR